MLVRWSRDQEGQVLVQVLVRTGRVLVQVLVRVLVRRPGRTSTAGRRVGAMRGPVADTTAPGVEPSPLAESDPRTLRPSAPRELSRRCGYGARRGAARRRRAAMLACILRAGAMRGVPCGLLDPWREWQSGAGGGRAHAHRACAVSRDEHARASRDHSWRISALASQGWSIATFVESVDGFRLETAATQALLPIRVCWKPLRLETVQAMATLSRGLAFHQLN